MKKWVTAIGLVVLVLGCADLVMDPSPQAVASGDLTLAVQACEGPLYSGFGICRVKEGARIDAAWQAVLPAVGGQVLGGDLKVVMRGVTKTYAIPETGVVTVPFSDLFGSRTWDRADTSILNATAIMRVKFNDGLEGDVMAEGQILVRVLSQGYDPMPIDSTYKAWGNQCKVQYSTAGRGAVTCG